MTQRDYYEGLACMLGVFHRECKAFCREGHRTKCQRRYLEYDAVSIAYDLEVAEASIERIRRSVAW